MGPLSVLQCRHVSLLTAVFLALVSTATWCPASATVHVLRLSSRFVWDIAASTSLRAEAFHHDDIDAHGDPVSSWGGASRQLLQDSTLCYRNQVQCPSGIAECYDYYKSCNGENDCSDGSDESSGFCAPFDCSAYAFRGKCPSGLCTTTSVNAPLYTPREFLCDGIKDCPDNSDEDPSFCANYDCASVGALTCPGPAKQCIRRSSSNNSIIYYTNPYGPSSTPDGFPTSICDGVKDCNDGSDEDPGLCSAFSCENGSFKCGDRCIGRYKLCDGVIDCPDGGSDEDPTLCGPTYNCSQAGLFGGYQRCPSGVGCYYGPQNNCNGRYECSDQSDEDPALCGADSQCYDRQVKCPGGVGCVYFEGICNGIFDCLDKSDESAEFCANRTCDSYHVKCPSGQGGCLAPSQICDGKVDCLDGSDESDATCSAYDCSGGGFRTRCPSGIGCADNFTLCDGIPGNGVSLCKDGSDEDPAFCAGFQCRFGGQIKCRDGTCHTGGNLCDGHTDCSDGSDEDPSYCQVAECASDESKCSDGIHCVSTALFCDGRFDCPDRSDESLEVCATRPCPFEGRVKCPGGNGQCIGATNLCDGVTDCQDGSDETSSLCETYDCGADRFKCPGTDVCVYGKPCNGVPNCPDRSDESEALCQSGTLSPSPTPSPIPIPPPGQTDAPAPIFPPPSDTPAPTTSSPSDTPAPTTPPPSDTLAPTTPSPSDTPAPTTPLPSNTPAPTTGAPSPTTGAATCDPNSGTPNQCFNAQGSASVCCPGQCPSNPGDTPACAGLGTGTCDPSSSTPNQCFNANGDQSVCCPGSCPGSPGPVAVCG